MNKRITYPDSAILTSLFIPFYFEPKILSTIDNTLAIDDNIVFDQDSTGQTSIIRFNSIPYIDLKLYDYNRKKYYSTDQYDNRWRVYEPGEWVIESEEYWNEDLTYSAYVSVDGLFNGDVISGDNDSLSEFIIKQFNPITIKLNGIQVTDISDYSGDRNIITKLDVIDPTNNKEFYYDKNKSIYTNQDLSLYDVDDIDITYYVNIKDINIHCRMNTNVTNLSSNTPIVDFYLIKLLGQNL